MISRLIRNTFPLVLLFVAVHYCSAQNNPGVKESETTLKQKANPFRITTSGKQITVKSNKDIKNIMAWTSSGHRILEEKNVNTSNYNFRINVNEKIIFLMLQLTDGKVYSEKIGIQ